MKKILILLVLVATSLLAQAQTRQLKVYLHSGVVDTLRMSSGSTIAHSRLNLQGERQDDYVTMIVTIGDSIRKYAIADLDSLVLPNGQRIIFRGSQVVQPVLARAVGDVTPDDVGDLTGQVIRQGMHRTSFSGTFPGSDIVTFYWTENDRIRLDVGDEARAEDLSADKTEATFIFDGAELESGSYVVYYPDKIVTIATEQTQTGANNSDHIGDAGDCGTALAELQDDGTYGFTLKHQASYLCFLPHIDRMPSVRISKIVLSSSSAIAGDYQMSRAGLYNGTNTSQTITLNLNPQREKDFVIGHSLNTVQDTCAAYMVIAPQSASCNFTVTYYLTDTLSRITTTYQQSFSLQPVANTVYPINSNIPDDLFAVVDMGLSTKWSHANLSATEPSQAGDTYTFVGKNDPALTSTVVTQWATPTNLQMQELIDGCTWEPFVYNGVNGYLVTAKNPGYDGVCHRLFLPNGTYWTSGVTSPDSTSRYSMTASGSPALAATAVTSQLAIRPVEVLYVDMGLPGHTMWATHNIGATTPSMRGDCYAWGETETKNIYSQNTYDPLGNGTGAYDNLDTNIAGTQYDVARVKWGGAWRMPTTTDFNELNNNSNCQWTWTTINGQNGHLITSKINGNTIFLPAAGYRYDVSRGYSGSYGFYYSSEPEGATNSRAYGLEFGSGSTDHRVTVNYQIQFYRYYGLPIRPVFTYTGSDLMVTSDSVQWKMGDTEAVLHGTFASMTPLTESVKVGFLMGDSLNLTVANADSVITFTRSANGTFSCTMPVYNDYGYYWRAYVQDADTVILGDVMEYGIRIVDLGLPSGTRWRNMNVGASRVEESGEYYQWGEVVTKDTYNIASYDPLGNGGGTYDNLDTNISGTQYDAARQNLGGYWRIPTKAEFEELRSNCNWQWVTINGQTGHRLTSKINGNSIFLPAAGYRYDASRGYSGSYGFYYSSEPEGATNSRAYGLEFGSGSTDHRVTVNYQIQFYRYYGLPIRPVMTYTGSDLVVTSDSVEWKVGDTEAVLHGTFATLVPQTSDVKVGFLVGDSLNLTVANADSVITFTRSANGTFEATMPVFNDVGHYWRAYAQDADTTMLGDVLDYGVRMIDLGLPSGVLWRNMNVGASRIEERGDYFAWGEVETKDTYDHAHYDPLGNGVSQYDNIGTDISGSDDYDAARHNLGGYWRMPTKAEFDELNTNCNWQWKTINGQTGYKLTSKINGNSIFLPAAGYRNGTSLYSVGSYGYYYSSVPEGATSGRAYGLQFYTSTHNVSYYSPSSMYRYNGYTIRPVAIPGTELSTGARIDIMTDTLTYVPGTDHAQLYGTLTKYNHWSDNMTVGFIVGDSATFTAATAVDTVTTIVRSSGQYTLVAPYGGGDKWFRAAIFDGENCYFGRAIHYGTTVTTDSASYRQGSTAETVTLYGALKSDPTTLTQPVKVGFYIGKNKDVDRATAIDSVKTTVDANGKFSLTIAARDTIVYYRAFVELNDTCRGYGISRHYGFAFVDLGLPSGTWWANTNMGAASEITNGDYYAWGEVQPKTQFTQDNYAHYNATTGWADLGRDIAYSQYDAATHAFDGLTSMPSNAQYAELFKYCTQVKDTVDGTQVTRFIGPNGNSIILWYAAWTSVEDALTFGHIGYASSTGLSSKYSNFSIRPVRRINAFDGNGVQLGVTADSARWSAESTVATLYGSVHAAEAFSPVKVGFVVGADTAVTKATADTIMSKQVSAAGQFSLTYNYKSRPAYYRAFVELSDTTYYGNARRVGEAYIDLGLPSHTLWADMNVGAEEPSGLGYYVAWGDIISTRRLFGSDPNCDTYDAENHNWKEIGSNIANTKYDGARAIAKGLWSLPTDTQWQELFNCTWTNDTVNTIPGFRVTGPNGKSIFVPTYGQNYYSSGQYANYWTANNPRTSVYDPTAKYANVNASDAAKSFSTIPRYFGLQLRAAATYTNILRDSTYLYLTADSCDWTPESTEVQLYGTLRSQTPLTGATYGMVIGRNNNPEVGAEGVTSLTTTNTNGVLTATTTLVGDRYYYRPYVSVGDTIYYGKERRYGYAMIDLGLPSHTLWADINLGATTDDGYGDYYQFGETEPQLTTPFDDSTLSLHQPITDSLGVIAHYQYDAASVQLGGVWSIPTRAEILELIRNCTTRPDTLNGTWGVRLTGPNGNSIFIPRAGFGSGSSFPTYNSGNYAYIASADVYMSMTNYVWQKAYYTSRYAPQWNGSNGWYPDNSYNSYYGFPIRPVAHVSDTLATTNKPVSAVLQKWMPKKAADGGDLLEARIYGVPVGKTISQMGIILGRDSLLTRDNGTVYTSQNTNYVVEAPAGVDNTNSYVTLVGCSYRTTVPHINSQMWSRPYFVVDGETYYGLPHTVGPRLVDLGLPSGTMWADINVGSIESGGEGEYYQWGELVPDDEEPWRAYSSNNYQYYNVFIGFDIARTKYDAATQKWGPMYAMPTDPQWNELLTNTTLRPDTVDGSYGMRFIGPNGNSIFMPYQGYRDNTYRYSYGYNSAYGYYWTSNQYGYDSNYSGNNNYSYTRYFYGYGSSTGSHSRSDYSRYYGMPIRPVGKISAMLADGTPIYLEPIAADLSQQGYQLTGALSLPSGITATSVGFYVGDNEQVNAETGTLVAAAVANDTITSTGYAVFTGNRRWFRPYAVINGEPVLGSAKEFGVELVDMGFPSGTKWANMNLGAHDENEKGGYYQWGDIEPDDPTSNLSYGGGSYDPLGDGAGAPDDLGADISGTQYDAVRAAWGNMWSMPTQDQFNELIANSIVQQVNNSNNNTIGYRFVSKLNGNSFFLPYAGYYYRSGSSLYNSSGCYYWTSAVGNYSSVQAYYFYTYGQGSSYTSSQYSRYYGLPLRPVARQNAVLADGTLVYVGGTGSHLHNGNYSFSGLVLNVPTNVTVSSAGFVVGADSLVTTETGTTLTATLVNDTLTSTQTMPDIGAKRWYRPFIVVDGQTVYGTASQFGVLLVDLGLPSGTLWADANLGASQPTEKGDFYLWGETTAPKTSPQTTAFLPPNYALYDNSTGFTDVGMDISYTEYDAAHVAMGGLIAMPTVTQMKELVANCSFVPEKVDGVPGVWAVSRINDNRIFLPANGQWQNSSGAPYYNWDSSSPDLYYWTSSIPENTAGNNGSANAFWSEVPNGVASSTTAYGGNQYNRYYGLGIRPVAQFNTTAGDGRKFYFVSDSVAMHSSVPEAKLYATAHGISSSMSDVTRGFIVGTSATVEITDAIGGAQSVTTLPRDQFSTTLDATYLDGLTVGTTYYARPFLTVGTETFYGDAMEITNSLTAYTDSTDWKQGATTVTFYGSADGATASSSPTYGFLVGDHADITAASEGVRNLSAAYINDSVFTAQVNDLAEGVHYYRAYAKVGTGYAYGIARRFGNGLVDLGLPSGTLWTTANLGSQNDFTVDSLYAWGEKAVKTEYTSANYAGTGTSEYVTDISRTAYDVARAKLGNSYFMPNMELWQELINNCTIVRDTVENVVCWKVTSKVEGYTDRFIYLPMTNLWTATRYSDDRANYRSNDNVLLSAYSYLGYGVRPVYQKNITTLNGDDMFLHADRIDYDTDEKTATLNGSVRGITTEMTDIQIGFVVGTTEDVDVDHAMTDGVFTNETATDGTFYNVLPATFVDKFAVGVTYYARPYITIGESETLYGNALAIRNTLTVTTDSCNWQYGASTTRLCGAVQGVTASSTPTYGFVVGKNATITAADEGVTIVNATLTDGVFKGSLTTPSGLNYYRAFAVENGQYVYGDARRFGLELVDLGLRSGTLWSNIDLGAQTEEESGTLYAWGETTPKTSYEYSNYDPKGDGTNAYDYIGNNIQFTQYDAATQNMGGLFAMPTESQWVELANSCTMTSESGGYRYTSKTDPTKSIFIASGTRWSSVMPSTTNSYAYYYSPGNTSVTYTTSVYYGYAVRPVYGGNVKLADETILNVATDSCDWQNGASNVRLYGTVRGSVEGQALSYGFVIGNKADVTINTTGVQNVSATLSGGKLTAQVANTSGKYYYRAYVKEGDNYFYGSAKSYGWEMVDLGLPSGTLWASVNLGASKEGEYGHQYAWGETHTKADANFTQANYDPMGNGGNVYDGIGTDIQHTKYDAARAAFGDAYAMPTRAQIEELYTNCTMTSTYVNGVSGYLYTSLKKGYTDKSIFIPSNYIWTSDIYNNDAYNSSAYYYSPGNSYNNNSTNRYNGYYIRPVYSGNVTLADETILHVAADSCDWQFGAAKVNVYGTVLGKVEGQTLTYGFVVGNSEKITVNTEGVQNVAATLTGNKLTAQVDNMIGRNFYRAYVKEDDNYSYSSAKSYGVELVDLGLPSGTLWTTVNLGASKESDYGDRYSWGETAAKSNSGSSYYDPIGDGTGGNDDIGMDIQHTKYDAATAAYGGVFAMPTREQMAELYTNCTMTSATVNNVSGYRYTSKTDATKSIFIPSQYIWMSEVYSSPTNGSAYYYYPGNSYNSNTNSRSSLCYIRAVYCGNVTLADQTVLNVTADSCDWQYGTANVNLYGTVRGSLEGHEATYGFIIGDNANINVNTEGVQNVNGTLSGTKLSALVPNTSGKHYYRAYVKEGENYYYGTAKYYGFELVDFGLPSGTLWSSLNIGATIESEVGNKYAWGETVVKTSYTEATYDPLSNGAGSYDNIGLDIQHSGFDAATAAYGGVYAMPTRAQITELHTYCNVNSATVNGISGYRYTSKTDATKSIFIPGSAIWTSEVYNNSATGNNAYYYSPSTSNNANGTNRYSGYYVRPVYCGNVKLADETVLNVSADSSDWKLDAVKVNIYGTVRGDVIGKTLTCGFVFGDNANVTVETTGAVDVPVSLAGNRLFAQVDNSAGRTYYRAYVKEGSNYFYSAAKNYGLGLVDLGLPSGTLWLDVNLGASTETEYGYQYAWGETAVKASYSTSNYDPLGNGTSPTYDNIGLNIQHTQFDAATVAYGDCYAMPTTAQIAELYNSSNCTKTAETINGVSGYRFTSKKAGYTDKSIFIPNQIIWTSEVTNSVPTYSTAYYYSPNNSSYSSTNRYAGYYIRPVYCGNMKLADETRLYVTTDSCDWHYTASSVNVYGTVMGKVAGKSLTYGFVIGDAANVEVGTAGAVNVSAALVNGKLSAQNVATSAGMHFYRAYVNDGTDYYYSPAKSYGVELVDLGLPSGTLWAATNLGAATESEFGNKYAWGETFAKTSSNGTSYYDPLGDGTGTYDQIGVNIQGTQYDAATAAFGGVFGMPTRDQIAELYNSNYCTKTSATVNGVSGYRFTSKKEGYTDKSIFIPNQTIWTSEIYNNIANAYAYYYTPSSTSTSSTYRYNGYYVRPVYNGGIQMSDGQRVNLVSSAAQFNSTDKTSTLSGVVKGLTAGMNISEVGFVVSDAETVGVSTAADGTFAATLGADGTFTTTLPTSFMDRYSEGSTLYMRAYAVIEGNTYYATNAVSWKLRSEITVTSINVPAGTTSSPGTLVMDYSEYDKVTINHLYDHNGTSDTYNDYCRGYIKLIAAPGCKWKITGAVNTESLSWDWVSIYDGTSVTPSGDYNSGCAVRVGGQGQSINYTSSSNVIYVCFRTDGSGHGPYTNGGFDLQLVAE